MALLRGMAIVLGGLVPHPAYAPDRGVGAGVVLVAGMSRAGPATFLVCVGMRFLHQFLALKLVVQG